jgi:hypothetical protein
MIPSVGWYEEQPDLTQLYQGDVLRNVPFPSWPTFLPENQQEKWGILRPLRSGNPPPSASMKRLPSQLEARAQRNVSDAFSDASAGEHIMALCHMRKVMIVTRSCQLDNERRKHLMVAPVEAISDLPESQRSEDKLTGLRSGEIPHLFYLPERSGMGESFADFLQMTYLHRSFLRDEDIRTKLVARLTSLGMMQFQHALADHFGKPFGFDHQDECPQDGIYSCSACFHSGREVTKREFRKGSEFGPCSICGEEAAFVLLP